MATFESTGHTVFREGDPAIPDIEAELKGRRPVAHVATPRRYSNRGGRSGRYVRLRSGVTGRFVRKLFGRSRGL